MSIGKNIGKKIKIIAASTFGIGVIITVKKSIEIAFSGFKMFKYREWTYLFEIFKDVFLVILLGFFISWACFCLIYGFGEIIDKLCDIERNTHKETNDLKEQKTSISNKSYIKATEFDAKYSNVICPICHESFAIEKGCKSITCPCCGYHTESND